MEPERADDLRLALLVLFLGKGEPVVVAQGDHQIGELLVIDPGAPLPVQRVGGRRAEVTLDPEPLPKQRGHPAVLQATRHPSTQAFLYWSRFPFFGIDEHPHHFEVHVDDARFSREVRRGWAGRRVPVPRSVVGR